MVANRVTPDQRATRWHACPICEGYDAMRRGRGERCKGYQSNDERFYFCSREEYAGDLTANANGDYKHRIDGQPCYCGHDHGVWTPPAMPKPASTPAPVAPQSGPLPRMVRGATLTREYPYRRADGSLAYRVARYDYPLKPGETKPDKTFSQFRQLSETTWASGLGDTERLLYRLPEILAAPMHRPVFVVEGEKCAEALAALGLVATTCPEGAGKWGNVPGRHDALRGRPVVVLPDQDKAGSDHAPQVAADLAGVASSVRIVELPNLPAKGDAVEWITDGGTALQLLELALATPAYDMASAQNSCPGTQDGSSQTNTPNAAALKMAETTVFNLRARDAWDAKLRRNASTRQTYKPIMTHIVDEWQNRRGRDPQGYMRIYRSAWAEKLGTNEKAISRQLVALEKAGAIERHIETEYLPGQLPRHHLSIRPTDTLLQSPDTIAVEGWGGKRERICSACGGSNLHEHKQIICHDCGTVQSSSTRPLSDSLDDAGDGPIEQEDNTPQSQNSCPGTQDGSSQTADDGHMRAGAQGTPKDTNTLPSATDAYLPKTVPLAQDPNALPADVLKTGDIPGMPTGPACIVCRAPKRWNETHWELTCECGAKRKAASA